MPKLTLSLCVAVGAILLIIVINTGRQSANVTVFEDSPKERESRLQEHWQFTMPSGLEPHSAAILLSGCDGVRDNMTFWSDELVRQGRATLIIDSHTPRRLTQLESWRLVCAGQAMTGAERAGDVAVAVHMLAAADDIRNDIVLFGASHGGWAAMEFVDLAVSKDPPPGLTKWPSSPDHLLSQVSAVVLLYPYCGFLNGMDSKSWPPDIPVLMILAEDDSIVSTSDCLTIADQIRLGGGVVETNIISGVDHGFDQREKSRFSTLGFDATQRDNTRDMVRMFLNKHTDLRQ